MTEGILNEADQPIAAEDTTTIEQESLIPYPVINTVDGGPHLDFRIEYQPTEKDLMSPLFNALWNVVKHWDIQRREGDGYSSGTGTDVMYLIHAIRDAGITCTCNADC